MNNRVSRRKTLTFFFFKDTTRLTLNQSGTPRPPF